MSPVKQSKWVTAAAWVLALVAGSLAAFFIVGPALFSDGSTGERMLLLGLSAVIFGMVGVALGILAPWAWRSAGIVLAAPVVVVALLFGLETLLLAVVFIVSDAAAALFGAWGGARIRLWQRPA